MHVTKTLALISALSTGALSFKVRAYSGVGCTGSTQEINVWDNTCRDSNVLATKSIRVLAYGAGRQRAFFWNRPECSAAKPDNVINDWWADGGSNVFKKGRCIDLKGTSHAYSSISS
ncbi:hypothetical protein FNYG_15859 [Fusarium nygamai]|uniref:Cyanovirin-N domain-containing protein n=1 Tax=Gibberella nygamai TaxID=42673 RepID=A0A2K0U3C6_GIBNY|nr:hypothetical protein FNYG_15859 [Fusarium nygamai]